MTLDEAIKARHSVRQYNDTKIDESIKNELEAYIKTINEESNLHIQFVYEENKAFDSFMAHYGKFSNVRNYLAIIGNKSDPHLEEKCGYYGEKIVLKAMQLGLSSCWVAMTYKKIKSAYVLNQSEKLVIVIALGYSTNKGVQHKSKEVSKVVSSIDNQYPDWFKKGVEYALLAPTAMNQQKFVFTLDKDIVELKTLFGPYSKIDAGIVRYHFEIGASLSNFKWKNTI